MATNRKIDSPGVQISEIDLSLRPVQTTGTTIFVPGFAPRGPINDAITVASLSEFEQIYGQPTNGAERYFYNTVKASLQSPANILVSRLPYGSAGAIDNSSIGLLAYPAVFVDTSVTNYITDPIFYKCNTTTAYTYVSAVPTLSAAFPSGIPAGNTVQNSISSSSPSTLWNGVSANFSTSTVSLTSVGTQNFTQATSGTYILGAPVHYTLTKSQFNDFQNGSLFTYSNICSGTLNSSISSLGNAALIIANQASSNINNLYEGYYVGVVDNTNLNPVTNFDTITKIKSLNTSATFVTNSSYQIIPSQRYGFTLSADSTDNGVDNSISQVLETSIVGYDTYVDRSYDDTLIIGLFKLKQSVFSSTSIQLGFALEEGYIGSLDSKRLINSTNGGPAQSFFIENQINSNSPTIVVKVNPYLSRTNGGLSYLQLDGTPIIKIRASNPTSKNNTLFTYTNPNSAGNSLTYLGFNNANVLDWASNNNGDTDAIFPLGSYFSANAADKTIGNVPSKLQTILNNLLNSDVYSINIACEGGLGTVYACSSAGTSTFNDYAYVNTQGLSSFNGSPSTDALVTSYQGVANTIQSFVENPARKDLIGILDPLTPVLVQSNSVKTINDPDLTNFTTNVLWPLKNQFAPYNSSYLVTYPTCVRVTDITTGSPIWVPFSGFAASIMANTDTNYQPWYAPAGFRRGIVSQVSDIAYYPRQKQRDQLYKSSFNPVAFFPSDGFVVYGQKTLLKAPSAFDRINVRRLFLAMEIATRDTLKYYVFEPNTLFTRTQVINALTPIFENAKNTQGIYDYLIICDERNNTPTVIDDNTLIVDIYIKPVRTAEFILANFYATRTGVNFQEIVS